MSNPIQQAIEALDWCIAEINRDSPSVLNARPVLTSLRSLQKEVEGVLPFPKYIYHFNPSTNEEDMFEFANSGAVDEGCVYCERLYTADQLRTAVAAALWRGAVPQDEPCFCDLTYPDADPNESCGDCPKRDYKATQPTQAEAPSEREDFERELRRQCFQKPSPEAYDLAWCMWQARAGVAGVMARNVAPPAPGQVERDREDAVLAYLDKLEDDAAVHIWPDDLAKCQTNECVVEVASVRMGSPDGKTLPLFSRDQVRDAIRAARYSEGGAS